MAKNRDHKDEANTEATAAVETSDATTAEPAAEKYVTIFVDVKKAIGELLAKKFPGNAPVPIVYDGKRGPAIGMAKAVGEPTRYFTAGEPQLVDDRELVVHLLTSKKGFAIAEAVEEKKASK